MKQLVRRNKDLLLVKKCSISEPHCQVTAGSSWHVSSWVNYDKLNYTRTHCTRSYIHKQCNILMTSKLHSSELIPDSFLPSVFCDHFTKLWLVNESDPIRFDWKTHINWSTRFSFTQGFSWYSWWSSSIVTEDADGKFFFMFNFLYRLY